MKRVGRRTGFRIYEAAGYKAWEYYTPNHLPQSGIYLTESGKYKLGNELDEDDLEYWNKIYDSYIDDALNPYTDKQLQKVVLGIEQGTQWESGYLKDKMLPKFKAKLRERKLNNFLVD